MKKPLQILSLAAAALGLFAAAFFGFGLVRGGSAHALPLIGGWFPAPAGEEESAQVEPSHGANEAPVPSPPKQAGLGLLDVFVLESPMAAEEIQDLARALKEQRAQVEQRSGELDEREERLDERALFMDEQSAALAEMRAELERWQGELETRQAELERGEAVHSEKDAASWQRMAKLFEKGEASALARRLEAWTPAEAAQLLMHLKPDRVRELLEALGGETWKDYWEAYRAAVPSETP
jgi:hypothetical protein